MNALKLRPYVPSGEDYQRSVQFYIDLGFEKVFTNKEFTLFRFNETEFHLQNYHNEELQAGYMLELCVQDLDAWWDRIQQSKIDAKYDMETVPPKSHPSGKRVLHLVDPAGVLWHITE